MQDKLSVVKERVLARLDENYDLSDQEIREVIRREISIYSKEVPLGVEARLSLENGVFNSLRKLDVLEELLEDEDITEIMINGPKDIFVEKAGRIEKCSTVFSTEEKLNDVIQHIVADANKIVNESSPIVDTRLKDGSRVNIVLPPAAVDAGIITIRKFPKEHMTVERLLELGSISQEIVDVLKLLVISGYNIFISGGTGSGKTSFLNAMAQFIPSDERVITIEDSAELQLNDIANLVRLEARSPNLEGKNAITIRDLLKSSLRMRPDRIIVGECRGGEALEMLQAFNTGHDGSFSTGHANSCKDMVRRLETMVLMATDIPLTAVRQQIAGGIDIFVHLGRLRDKSRKVLEIVEVDGLKEGDIDYHSIYKFEEEPTENLQSQEADIYKNSLGLADRRTERKIKGKWIRCGDLKATEKLAAAGLLADFQRLMQ